MFQCLLLPTNLKLNSRKRTQHCCPTTLNIFGCYISYMLSRLSPFVRCMLLRVVGSCCAKFETAVKLLASCKRTQQLSTMLGVVGQQFCVRFHGAKSLYFISFLVNTVLLNSFVSAFSNSAFPLVQESSFILFYL